MSGRIGYQQLSDHLKNILKNTNAGIKLNKNSIIITNNTKNVKINIDLFNKNSDELLVFKNSIYIANGYDYIINEDNTISPADGSEWEASYDIPMEFSYLSITNIPFDRIQFNGGQVLAPGSIDLSKLSQDVINLINSGSGGGSIINPDQGYTEQNIIDIINNAIIKNKINNLDKKENIINIIKNAINLNEIDIVTENKITQILSEYLNANNISYNDITTSLGTSNVQETIEKIIEILNSKPDGNISVIESQIEEILKKFNAKDISYDDNLTSLGASNVQNAIEKINANIPSSADDISYNDILTQISASTVQEAISKLNNNILQLKQIVKNLIPKYTEIILLHNNWSGNTYSFQSVYPFDEYELTIIGFSDNASELERDAYGEASIVSVLSDQTIKALGKVPNNIDIHLILKVVKKNVIS